MNVIRDRFPGNGYVFGSTGCAGSLGKINRLPRPEDIFLSCQNFFYVWRKVFIIPYPNPVFEIFVSSDTGKIMMFPELGIGSCFNKTVKLLFLKMFRMSGPFILLPYDVGRKWFT